ncbi:MAG TPA: N-acetylmuramic acid 6-phosphate etherase [Ktedonobacterales bacterium]|nr:N-acetylmuramic acid 6-phosphate etherase [Ktedonobacterales bacterium]
MATSNYPDQPDRSLHRLVTEQSNAASVEIDQMTPLQIVQLMNMEDAEVAVAVAKELPSIAAAIEAIAARLRNGGRLIYLGAGTSGRLGALDAAECPPTFDISPDRIIGCIAGGSFALSQAAEDLEDSAEAGSADIARLSGGSADALVGITASGRTPYVLGAVASARERGMLVVGLACNSNTPLHEGVDIMIAPDVGPEVIAGSTRLKAGTAQKMVLNMLSTATMVRLGKTFGNLMVDVRATNQKLRERALSILAQATGLPRAQCEEELAAADGELKTAILSVRANLTPAAARERLARHDGVLRVALENAP